MDMTWRRGGRHGTQGAWLGKLAGWQLTKEQRTRGRERSPAVRTYVSRRGALPVPVPVQRDLAAKPAAGPCGVRLHAVSVQASRPLPPARCRVASSTMEARGTSLPPRRRPHGHAAWAPPRFCSPRGAARPQSTKARKDAGHFCNLPLPDSEADACSFCAPPLPPFPPASMLRPMLRPTRTAPRTVLYTSGPLPRRAQPA